MCHDCNQFPCGCGDPIFEVGEAGKWGPSPAVAEFFNGPIRIKGTTGSGASAAAADSSPAQLAKQAFMLQMKQAAEKS